MSRDKFVEAVGRYWDLAYREGCEGREVDTPEGDAGSTLAEIMRLYDERATVQPNGATGWIDNAVTPPGESVERVLVAYPTGLVETTQAHYVRLYPTNYPWWMPLPVAPSPTDGVA